MSMEWGSTCRGVSAVDGEGSPSVEEQGVCYATVSCRGESGGLVLGVNGRNAA